METEKKLFEIKDLRVDQLWDVLRMNVYLAYYFPNVEHIDKSKESYWTVVKRQIYMLGSSLIYYIKKVGEKSLVIPNSRYYDNGVYYDKASLNVITALGNNAFVIEPHLPQRKYKYSSASGLLISLFSRKYSKASISKSSYDIIQNALSDYMGDIRVTKEALDDVYRHFLTQRAYYSFIFSIKKFKTVYFVQNGSFKGVVSAAKKKKIRSVEIQHGSFELDHLSYSYPQWISYKYDDILMPDCMLTFGPYWGHNVNLPIRNIVVSGNDFFVKTSKSDVVQDSIVVISSMIHWNDLLPLTVEIASKYKEITIYYKLHSNEYCDAKRYFQTFKYYPNVLVVTNQYDVTELIYSSKLVILISSTVLYEALNFNRKVAIFKRVNYEGLKCMFGKANVFEIDKVEDVEDILNASTITTTSEYFVPFNKRILNGI